MSLERLRHHQQFLLAGSCFEAALRLSLAFRRATLTVRQERLIAPGVLTAIEQDLIYALLKHRHWRNTPLFKSVLDDHLCHEYGLPQALVQRLSGALIVAPGDGQAGDADLSHLPRTDGEFLRYVCIASATANCEAQLIV